VRKAKDNSRVPTRYFRPPIRVCPRCGAWLERHAPGQDKFLITLEGRFRLVSLGYRCPRPRCPYARQVVISAEPARWGWKGLSFGFEVLVQVGRWRFWEPRTREELWVLARQRFPISRRQGLYLIVDFLCLLAAAQPARIERYRALYARRGLWLSIDARPPETGHEVVSVVRELRQGLTLRAAQLSHHRAETLRTPVLEPLTALGFEPRAVVSDAEDAIPGACQDPWPGCPPQLCHFPVLREAAKPITEANQALMLTLKREVRTKLRPVRRAIQALAVEETVRPILLDYAEALRSRLRVSSGVPFNLGGLRVFANLQARAASLRRCQKTVTTPSWASCWQWPSSIAPMPCPVAALSTKWAG
jgi:hypothetical protein